MKAAAAELLGTAALLAVVVGSGIMGQRMSPSNLGVALLANALATGFALRAHHGALARIRRATTGLLVTIAGFVRHAPMQVPAAVGVYIAAAYWFTASPRDRARDQPLLLQVSRAGRHILAPARQIVYSIQIDRCPRRLPWLR